MVSKRTKYLTEIINKTRNATFKVQQAFVSRIWNYSGDRLERIARTVRVVNGRIEV